LVQQRPQAAAQRAVGEGLGAAAGGPEGRVGGAEVVADAGGAEPGGDGAAAAGAAGADAAGEQTRGGTGVEGSGDVAEPGGQGGGQLREGHGRLLGTTWEVEYPASCPGSRRLSTHRSASRIACYPRAAHAPGHHPWVNC